MIAAATFLKRMPILWIGPVKEREVSFRITVCALVVVVIRTEAWQIIA